MFYILVLVSNDKLGFGQEYLHRLNFFRESFFKTLNTLGVLQALEITLAADNRQTKSASVDILLFIVDFSPSMVREYMLQQLNNTEDVSL